MMSKKMNAALVCVVGLLSMLLIPTVLANKPEFVEGTLVYTPFPVVPTPPFGAKITGNNIFLDTYEEGDWTGDIVGHSDDDPCLVVIHGPEGVWPKLTGFDFKKYTGIATFVVCTIDTKTGGLVMQMHGKCSGPGEEWDGQWVILKGTGGLEGVHGQGTWWGLGAPGLGKSGTINYQGWVHFDPS